MTTAAVGVTSSVSGVADYVAAAALLAVATGWAVVAMIRRELRIRRIAAAASTRPPNAGRPVRRPSPTSPIRRFTQASSTPTARLRVARP